MPYDAHMDTVRPWLLVGKLAHTLDYNSLLFNRVHAMLQLAAEVKQPGIAHLYLNVNDREPLAPEILEQGVGFIRSHAAEHKRVLVACGAGMSRAPTFAIAALCVEEDLSLLDAYRVVVSARPIALPHQALWRSLCQWRGEEIAYKEVLRLSAGY